MKAALVRTKETKQLVGFYVYQDNDELLDFIDRICNPDDCNYKLIESGGIVWDGPDDGVLDDNYEAPGAQFSYELVDAVDTRSKWKCCTKLYESN